MIKVLSCVFELDSQITTDEGSQPIWEVHLKNKLISYQVSFVTIS